MGSVLCVKWKWGGDRGDGGREGRDNNITGGDVCNCHKRENKGRGKVALAMAGVWLLDFKI